MYSGLVINKQNQNQNQNQINTGTNRSVPDATAVFTKSTSYACSPDRPASGACRFWHIGMAC